MHEWLTIAFWQKPIGSVLDDVETSILDAWSPPLNISKIRDPAPRLRLARKEMADEASRGAP